MSGLIGKRTLVASGSQDVGAAIARRLAADGAHVAMPCDRSAERAHSVADEIKAQGRNAPAVHADADGPQADAQRALLTIPRYGRSVDVAALVAFPAGTHASSNAAAGFTVDGGTNA